MADETPPDEGQPTPEAPPEGTSATETKSPEFFSEQFDVSQLEEPLQQRYQQMQADYTRKTMEASEQRKQAETAIQWIDALQSEETRDDAFGQLAQAFGYEIPVEDEEVWQQPDPNEQMLAEWEQFKSTQQQQQTEQQLAQLESEIQQGIESTSKSLGHDLNDHARALVFNQVIASPPRDDGTPDIEGAITTVIGLRDEWIKGYRASKTEQPAAPLDGSSGSPEVPLNNPKARMARALEVANEVFGGE